MRTGKSYQRALCLAVDLANVDLDLLTYVKCLAGDLLICGENCGACIRVDESVARLAVYLENGCGDDLFLLIFVCVSLSKSFSLADTLNDDRLCSA